MQSLINDKRATIEGHHLSYVGDSPVCYHCHHFNLFFDQTIDDAIGPVLGNKLRTQAAHDAAYLYLKGLVAGLPATTPSEQLDLASSVFAAMGHGRLDLAIPLQGGEVKGQNLHYGHAWQEKYGENISRKNPTDAFAAGFAAAAHEIAYQLPAGSRHCTEEECTAVNHRDCKLTISPGTDRFTPSGSSIASNRRLMGQPSHGIMEQAVENIANQLRDFLIDVEGDKRGLVDAFGVFVTMHLPNYYNHCANRTLKLIARDKPAALGVFRALLTESGHVCAFHTIGGILSSPEWEAMVGPIRGEPEEILVGGLAIARALGFGRWATEEFVQGQRLVLTASGTYESMYPQRLIANRANGEDPGGCCFLFQGGGLGLMELMHRIDWSSKPMFAELYPKMRRDLPWRVEETQCLSRGDDVCRVVVEAT